MPITKLSRYHNSVHLHLLIGRPCTERPKYGCGPTHLYNVNSGLGRVEKKGLKGRTRLLKTKAPTLVHLLSSWSSELLCLIVPLIKFTASGSMTLHFKTYKAVRPCQLKIRKFHVVYIFKYKLVVCGARHLNKKSYYK